MLLGHKTTTNSHLPPPLAAPTPLHTSTNSSLRMFFSVRMRVLTPPHINTMLSWPYSSPSPAGVLWPRRSARWGLSTSGSFPPEVAMPPEVIKPLNGPPWTRDPEPYVTALTMYNHMIYFFVISTIFLRLFILFYCEIGGRGYLKWEHTKWIFVCAHRNAVYMLSFFPHNPMLKQNIYL